MRLLSISVAALMTAALAATPSAASSGPASPKAGETGQLPVVTPTPQHMRRIGADSTIPGTVVVLAGRSVDQPTKNVISSSLRAAGARTVRISTTGAVNRTPRATPGALTVVVGSRADAGLPAGKAEGYSLVSESVAGNGFALLLGNDSDGTFYAAQTLRQLTMGKKLPSVLIDDAPSVPLRGSIEGFYGAPWSHEARLDQLKFYGTVKMNTYVYTPKDDPYLRAQWRDEYPAADLASLKELVDTAKNNHVRFTYALSPGLSMCYSDSADIAALEKKLQSIYDIGVREFSIPLDDISYTKWNCAGDEQKYGPAGQAAAGAAQVDLLNTIQHDFIGKAAGAGPLQTVPTEYYDVADSPYKKAIREKLDPAVLMMWTGVGVIPASVTIAQAKQANAVWGRKVYLWDNYPVNDYAETQGRLLVAPYEKREAGLSAELSGIVLNPMVQSHPSKVALYGAASYSWNDTNYDAQRTWRAAADYFSAGDQPTTDALLAFFDTEHYAPSSYGPWQPQAPVLKAKLDAFTGAYTGSAEQKHQAVAALRPYQQLLAGASAQIRVHVADKEFRTECQPWLDALALWGNAFGHTLNGLDAKADGNTSTAQQEFATSADLVGQASAITTIPGTTRPQGPILLADTVLDTFLTAAPQR